MTTGLALKVSSWALMSVSLAICIARIAVVYTHGRKKLGASEYAIIVAHIITLHSKAWDVKRENPRVATLSVGEMTEWLKLTLITGTLYYLCVWSIKACFCCLYYEVMSRLSHQKHVKFLLWSTNAFVFCTFLAALIAQLLECRPLSRAWAIADGPGRYCSYYTVRTQSIYFGLAIVADLSLLLFPILLLQQLPHARKGIFFLLFVSSISIVGCVMRFVVPVANISHTPLTERSRQIILWSNIELFFGLLAACLPGFRRVGYEWATKRRLLVGSWYLGKRRRNPLRDVSTTTGATTKIQMEEIVESEGKPQEIV